MAVDVACGGSGWNSTSAGWAGGQREGREAESGEGVEEDGEEVANRCMMVKKKSARETLFVEWVEGKPYSLWWFPIARTREQIVNICVKM